MKGFCMLQKEIWEPESKQKMGRKGTRTSYAGSQDLWEFRLFGEIHLACSAKKYEQGFRFIFTKNPTSEHLVCAKSPTKARSMHAEAGSAQFPVPWETHVNNNPLTGQCLQATVHTQGCDCFRDHRSVFNFPFSSNSSSLVPTTTTHSPREGNPVTK